MHLYLYIYIFFFVVLLILFIIFLVFFYIISSSSLIFYHLLFLFCLCFFILFSYFSFCFLASPSHCICLIGWNLLLSYWHFPLSSVFFSTSFQSCPYFQSDSTICLHLIMKPILLSKRVVLHLFLWCLRNFKLYSLCLF